MRPALVQPGLDTLHSIEISSNIVHHAERTVADFAAGLCFLGAGSLWPDFGQSAENALESGVKRVMPLASTRVVVVASEN